MCPSSSAARMRSARTSRMRALVCEVSVTIPACDPVSEIARWPRSLITIAASAHDWRSPVESNMSISRGSGWSETSLAISISSSVVCPRADSTATTRLPCSFAATIRRAARLMRSASATEVPPNFMTTIWACSRPGIAASASAWAGWAMAPKDSFPRMRRQIAAIVVLGLLVAGGIVFARSRGEDKPTTLRLPAATASGDNGPDTHISFLERLIPPPPERIPGGPAAPRSISDLARRLPLDRAVGQLFLLGFTGKDATAPIFQELQMRDLGGLVLDGRNYDTPQQLAALTGNLSGAATNARHLPPWVMAEQDVGDYSQFSDLPPTHQPGDFHAPAGAAAALNESATSLKALGFNGLLEPDLDVAARDGALGARAFSDDPAAVADYARRSVAACRALQLFCAAKHFPGIGAADTPTDVGAAQVGLSFGQLMGRDVVPFAAAIKAGIPGLVVGEGLYEQDNFVTPAALSPKIIGGLLRKRLRFGGLAITDDLADPGVSTFEQIPDAAVQAIKSGADMVYVSGDLSDQESAYTAVLNAVRSGEIPAPRVRQALLRVLLTKQGYGLLVNQPQTSGANLPQTSG